MRYLIASMAIAASTTFSALGATLYVTPAGAGNKDGSSWANAFAGIQAAVDAADAAYLVDGTIHDILVTNGTYTCVNVTNNFELQVRSVNGLGAADAVTDGQPNLIRYAFDKPTGAFSPITGISFDANGKPVVNVLPLNADAEGYVKVKVLSTTNLADWAHAEEVEIRIDSNGEIAFPTHGEDTRFYRVKAEE